MGRRWRMLGGVVLGFLTVACGAGPGGPAASQPAEAPSRSDRTLVIAVRTEPYSIAPRALEGGGVGLDLTIRVFNAGLELIDDKGVASPYLAEALPGLNTDSWR